MPLVACAKPGWEWEWLERHASMVAASWFGLAAEVVKPAVHDDTTTTNMTTMICQRCSACRIRFFGEDRALARRNR